jgi:hypothetical protein
MADPYKLEFYPAKGNLGGVCVIEALLADNLVGTFTDFAIGDDWAILNNKTVALVRGPDQEGKGVWVNDPPLAVDSFVWRGTCYWAVQLEIDLVSGEMDCWFLSAGLHDATHHRRWFLASKTFRLVKDPLALTFTWVKTGGIRFKTFNPPPCPPSVNNLLEITWSVVITNPPSLYRREILA